MESTLEEDEGGKNLEEEMHRWRQRTNEAAATAKKTRRREDASVSWPRLTHRDANRDAKRVSKGFTLTQ